MDRIDIYSLEQIRVYDQMWAVKDALKANGWSNRLIVGQNLAVWNGFTATQTGTPSLQINVGEGWVYSPSAIDATPWTGFPSDAQIIMQQGYAPAGSLTLTTSGLSAGQSQWALVEVSFTQTDMVRAGDPNGGILPYLNSASPTQPLNGPNNNGATQSTVRLGVATLAVKYGAPAPSSPLAPAADANCLPMYLILLTAGQTSITNGQILLAGPNAYAGYPSAPYFPGLIGTIPGASAGSHHGAVAGQAAKINLTSGAEVTGIAAFTNLPCTNGAPNPTGGSITLGGELAVITQGTVTPTGNVSGGAGDLYLNINTNILYNCTTSGTAGTAVWAQLSTGDTVIVKTANFTAAFGGNLYLCNTAGGSFTATLPTAASMAGTTALFKNIGANEVTILPQSGETIEGGAFTNGAPMILQKFQAVKLAPVSGTGWFIVS